MLSKRLPGCCIALRKKHLDIKSRRRDGIGALVQGSRPWDPFVPPTGPAPHCTWPNFAHDSVRSHQPNTEVGFKFGSLGAESFSHNTIFCEPLPSTWTLSVSRACLTRSYSVRMWATSRQWPAGGGRGELRSGHTTPTNVLIGGSSDWETKLSYAAEKSPARTPSSAGARGWPQPGSCIPDSGAFSSCPMAWLNSARANVQQTHGRATSTSPPTPLPPAG